MKDNRSIDTEALLIKAKQRIWDKLDEQPYTNDAGEVVDPLSAQALASLVSALIKLDAKENDKPGAKYVEPIPSFPDLSHL